MGCTEQSTRISRYVHIKHTVLVYSVKSVRVIRFLVSLNLTEVNKKRLVRLSFWFHLNFGLNLLKFEKPRLSFNLVQIFG